MTGERVFAKLREKKHWLLLSGGIVLFTGYHLLEQKNEEAHHYEPFFVQEEANEIQEREDDHLEKETSPERDDTIMMVDVKGAVQNPGVYPVFPGERVVDVLKKAGGLREDADDTKINLSQKVSDEMVIYVPRQGEETASVASITSSAGGSSSEGDKKVNINTADREELQTLPGIGPAKADAIIEYRESHGPFQTIEDILNVSGIGEKSFEKLKDQITVQ